MRLLQSCIYFLLIACVTLLCGEGVIRVYYHYNPHYFISSYYLFSYNEHFGNWHNPNIDMVWTKEGSGHIKTNVHGMIGKEYLKEKGENVYRIVVLGDSFTEGLQVDYTKNYCALLEEKLNAYFKGTQKIEVLNFGISGHGTTQSYELLKEMALAFDPDFVILGFFPGNDVFNNCRELQKDSLRPYYMLTEDGEVRKDLQAQKAFEAVMYSRNHSILYTALNAVRNRLYSATFVLHFIKSYSAGEIKLFQRTASTASKIPQAPLYKVPIDDTYDQAWKITEEMLLKLRDLCQERGISFLLLQISCSHEVDRSTREAYVHSYPNDDVEYPTKRLFEYSAAHHISLLQLTDYFLSVSAHDPTLYFHGFNGVAHAGGHWNQSGHFYCAEALLNYFIAKNGIQK